MFALILCVFFFAFFTLLTSISFLCFFISGFCLDSAAAADDDDDDDVIYVIEDCQLAIGFVWVLL